MPVPLPDLAAVIKADVKRARGLGDGAGDAAADAARAYQRSFQQEEHEE